ncbi:MULTISPECIES: ABC transporter ATP-binding protein [Brevibacterium]|uniref:ABC-type quaternary amine transporter n=2 Tax=Brevibacterium antiquum TaxID=234835 RepID=A0A2H1IUW4_9MICO|nr:MULTISPECIES: ABC transporter ATP-binding protein [Brevibacterium]SMX74998.1 putative spermidine/putrescine transport system ATP-binding protein [Brevibacterium antiquum]SMX79003.1 putative spermidine/putrescine transport system ATP-binding protein [Brevibacterium antiquum CNRZ 918]HCG56165.1 ABC transporter ATP-binding protein [Brevibacterium sp.]
MSTATKSPPIQAAAKGRGESMSVRFDRVSKSYGDTEVLRDFSIDIAAGSMVSFLGPSGCGKTTTLRILAGFEPVNGGDVIVGGESVLQLPPNQRSMGMVFQSYSLFPNLSVLDNIEYGLRIRKVDGSARRRRSEELLEICGLTEMGTRYPHQLSGGQQQRVALARALATQPKVLLLDEPLSALDASVRSSLRDEIRRVQQTLGTTTVFITHDQGEALAIADRVAVMNAGGIEQYSAPDEIYSRPATSFVARFVGSINEFAVPANWATGDRLPITSDADDVIFVRPENLSIAARDDGFLQVKRQTYTGERTMIHLGRPDSETAEWSASVSSASAGALQTGTRVEAAVTADAGLRLPRAEAEGARA